jgi:hypothetical protein
MLVHGYEQDKICFKLVTVPVKSGLTYASQFKSPRKWRSKLEERKKIYICIFEVISQNINAGKTSFARKYSKKI